MNGTYKIEDAAATHVGNVRSENEDSMLSVPQSGVWLVADGMGGHSHGRYASTTIVEALDEAQVPEPLEDAIDAVAEAVHAANETIYTRSLELGTQMGSTFVSLVIRGSEFGVLWAGDSRAYLFRDGHLIPLTRDHTQVEALLERGLLTPEEAQDHPMKHVLARAVGVQEDLQIDAIRDEIASRDIFLLCSDGLYGVLGEQEIVTILREKGHDACDDLINACLERGAPDNVTVALVEAREPTLLALNGAAN
ncbi:MAG: serine/threonine-protein phosphatase [Novosphingobium sp.]|nr:serine/threonine-protein phosphatase [Novosphingobium sp.]